MVAQLVVVGGGRMGEALVAGLAAARWPDRSAAAASDNPHDEVVIVEKLAERRNALALRFGEYPLVTIAEHAGASAGAVVAVKPGDVAGACRDLSAQGTDRVLSIAAGVTLRRLEGWLPDVPVIRAMPNMPALVGAGACAISAGSRAEDDDMSWAEQILGAVGIVVRLPETSLDAVTGLSGSGPAYIFLVAEALIEAGVLVGLPRDVSVQLATQTLLGSAQMLASSTEGPAALRAAVTSPGGTTAAGLRALEDRAVRSAFLAAVSAATERSARLGEA